MEKEKIISGDSNHVMNIVRINNKKISISIYDNNILKHVLTFNIFKSIKMEQLRELIRLFKDGYNKNIKIIASKFL